MTSTARREIRAGLTYDGAAQLGRQAVEDEGEADQVEAAVAHDHPARPGRRGSAARPECCAAPAPATDRRSRGRSAVARAARAAARLPVPVPRSSTARSGGSSSRSSARAYSRRRWPSNSEMTPDRTVEQPPDAAALGDQGVSRQPRHRRAPRVRPPSMNTARPQPPGGSRPTMSTCWAERLNAPGLDQPLDLSAPLDALGLGDVARRRSSGRSRCGGAADPSRSAAGA